VETSKCQWIGEKDEKKLLIFPLQCATHGLKNPTPSNILQSSTMVAISKQVTNN